MTKEIVVNYLNKEEKIFKIVPMKLPRDWMDNAYNKFPYKCLPLNIANQYGWQVLSPCDFSVSWYGGQDSKSVDVFSDDKDFNPFFVASHFGEATFTLQLDFIIQTPENYSLYIRGVPNKEYGIVRPLDAIVETDWLPFTFTYNLKFMEPGTVHYKKDEPMFSFFPIERNTVENFSIRSEFIENNQKLHKDFLEYGRSRERVLRSKNGDFQKFYFNGRGPFKEYKIINHLKKIFFKEIDS